MKVLVIFACLVAVSQAAIDTSVCQEVTSNDGPSLPTVPSQFTTHIQMNVESHNRSVEIQEVYDGTNNRGVIRTFDYNLHVRLMYGYEYNELFTIVEEEKVCQTEELSTSAENFIFGYNSTGGSGHIFSGSGALHFAGQFPEFYQGTAFVRGIPCRWWYSCVYWPEMDATMKVDYYWSHPDQWIAASGDIQVPVRATVQGKVKGRSFLHSYEFINFRSDYVDEFMMQVPRGIVCPRLVNPKEMPTMGDHFSFKSEMLTPDWNQIIDLPLAFLSPMDEWYDFKTNLFRLDYRPLPNYVQLTSDNIKSTGLRSEVHDYNTGVAYITDTVLGNCTARKISETAMHPESDLSGLQSIKLANPRDFFKYDSATYSYVGTRIERDVNTQVFIGNGYYSFGGKNQSTTFEWQFLDDGWYQNIGQVIETKEPVKLTITPTLIVNNEIKQFRLIYNMYDFDQEEPSPTVFDISPCFRDEHFKHYSVALPGRYRPDIDGKLNAFKYTCVQTLSKIMEISPIRIGKLDVYFDMELVFVMFSVLDKAPIQGDIPVEENSLEDATNRLADAVSSDRLIFNIDATKPVVAISDSLREVERDRSGAVVPESDAKYTAAQLGGLSFGMLVVGVLLTAIVAVLVVKFGPFRR